MPTDDTDVGRVAILPDEITRLPREKRIPEPKPETKWEKFAKEKGIQKKKRDRMIFDEVTQQWAPRFGYKRANAGVIDQPIIEVKAGEDPFKDPWAEARTEKKARVQKNLKAQERNQRLSQGRGGKAGGKGECVFTYHEVPLFGTSVDGFECV